MLRIIIFRQKIIFDVDEKFEQTEETYIQTEEKFKKAKDTYH